MRPTHLQETLRIPHKRTATPVHNDSQPTSNTTQEQRCSNELHAKHAVKNTDEREKNTKEYTRRCAYI